MRPFLFSFLFLLSFLSCNSAISKELAANFIEINSGFFPGPSKITFTKDDGSGSAQGYWNTYIENNSVGKVLLDQFESEGGDPEMVSTFVDSLASSRQKILFLIVKWRQVHRQEKVNGDQYSVRAFTDKVVSGKNGSRKLAPHDSLSKRLGGGFQGEFQGRESFFQFKNQASIHNELMGMRRPEVLSPCFHTYANSKGKSSEARICLDSLVNENRLVRYSMDSKTIAQLNDAGYFLNESGNFLVALQILKKVVESAPKRTVAYLNLADVLWNVNQLEEAKAAYQQYFQMMSAAKKTSKIPSRVSERINDSIANGE
jgi:Tetratricopeptide repeat